MMGDTLSCEPEDPWMVIGWMKRIERLLPTTPTGSDSKEPPAL